MAMVAVGIRLEREVWERHSAAAQTLGMPLSVYLRQRLDEVDRTGSALAELRSVVERTLAATAARSEPSPPLGMFVEMLYMLRILVGPQKSAMVQKEAERQGLAVWP